MTQDNESSSSDPKPDNIGWTCPECDTDIERGEWICWNCRYDPSAC